MEETLGKRIVSHRRRLGLTQEALAEKMGVTAQAVSKWENDQSCPDIAALPKLAAIFGISTDALLGLEPPAKEAEVVEESAPGIHIDNHDNRWEVKWDAGRKGSLGFALWVLLVGGLLLSANILGWETKLWDIVWTSGLMFFGLWNLWPRFSFFKLGCALFGGYFLANHLIPDLFVLEKAYLLPICLLLFGLSLLADALKKSRKPSIRVKHNGNTVKTDPKYTFRGEHFSYDVSFGEGTQRVDLPRISSGDASLSFGSMTLDLRGCGEIAQNCKLDLDCAFGEMTVLVPKSCRVEPTSDTAFASLEISGHADSDAQAVIHANCDASFGHITIEYC